MAAGAWTVYDKVKEYIGNKVIDFDIDTFKVVLCDSTSNAAITATTGYASLTGELATANGYTQGGVALSSLTWADSGGTTTWDAADMTDAWTASGGSIVARFAVIYDSTVTTPVANPLICYCLLDATPADITVTDTNTLSINMNAAGIFDLT